MRGKRERTEKFCLRSHYQGNSSSSIPAGFDRGTPDPQEERTSIRDPGLSRHAYSISQASVRTPAAKGFAHPLRRANRHHIVLQLLSSLPHVSAAAGVCFALVRKER